MDLLFGALFVLGAFIFRKSVANDLIDRPFSVIGSALPSVLGFIIASNIFDKLKFPVIIGLALFIIGGFLVGDLLADGFADGGSA